MTFVDNIYFKKSTILDLLREKKFLSAVSASTYLKMNLKINCSALKIVFFSDSTVYIYDKFK